MVHRKSLLTVISVMLVLLVAVAGAQIPASVAQEETPASYPIPGSHLLWKQEQKVREFLRDHPDAMQQHALRKGAAWGFSVGSTHNWYADDFTNDSRYVVASTCRAVGTNCYIFVEDINWGTKVTQAVVDSVRAAFDAHTPSDGTKGVYQTDVGTFGNPPDVDADPRIIILLLDIKDGYTGSGGYVAGYFYGFNEVSKSQPGYGTSNEAEIYFLDVNPANLTTPAGLTNGMSTTAHEFQHMIHFNYDRNEISFVNESCSLVAEVICGYGVYQQSGFASEPNHYLFDWRSGDFVNVLKDYSRGARWGVYLNDQFGSSVFKPIVASALNGSDGIDAGLATFGTPRRFNDILQDWFIANILDDASVDSKYAYQYPNLPKVVGKTYYGPNVSLTTDTVQRRAAQYVSFVSGSDLRATFNWTSPNVLVKAVKTGSGGNQVVSVASGVEFHEAGFGTTYSKIHFVVMNTDPSMDATFSYSSSGSVTALELKYDETEPVGYLQSVAGDTVCVWFSAVPGATLDSIRVALRRAGSMTGGVWAYTGVASPSPLGTPLVAPFTASISTTTPVPYPIPFQNWTGVDLRSSALATNQAFAVAFRCEGLPASLPRVMVTEAPTPATITSLTYSTSSAKWLYYVSNTDGDTVYTYLIRAYVSFGPSAVEQPIELRPASFGLGQNYPNPFNPSTVIEYKMPQESFVTLRVYDMMGREIAVLVEGKQSAGTHQVEWNAGSAPSGVYFYRLTAGSFTETKKLVLVQ